jgi:hypothetical protein
MIGSLFTFDVFDQTLPLSTVILQQITINISGFVLLLIFLAVGGYTGYQQGWRAVMTIALFSVLAYVLTVSSGQQVVDFINRFWTNLPRLGAFLLGRDVGTVEPFPPLIGPDIRIPLFFRIVFFIAIVVLGFLANKGMAWYAGAGKSKAPFGPFAGLLLGAFTALLWVGAASLFWQEFVVLFGVPDGLGFIANVLSTLPDVTVFITPLITIFFLVLILGTVLNFPKVWKA